MTKSQIAGTLLEIANAMRKHDAVGQGVVLAHLLALYMVSQTREDGPSTQRIAALEGIVELAGKLMPVIDRLRSEEKTGPIQ